MAYDVHINIKETQPLGRAADKLPCIIDLGYGGEGLIDKTKCKNLDDVKAAGFEEDSKTYKAATLLLSQEHHPAEFYVYGNSVIGGFLHNDGVADGVRQVILLGVTQENATNVASEWKSGATKHPDIMLFIGTSQVPMVEGGFKDIDNVVVFGHMDDISVAGFVGEATGRPVGSFNYKNLILKGIAPSTADDIMKLTFNLDTSNVITLVEKAGDNVTTGSKTVTGDYIDILDIKDYVVTQMKYRIQRKLNLADKIPYDDTGIAMIENVCVSVLKECYDMGIIATVDGAPAYTVNFKKRAETTEEERASRKYTGGAFSFVAAGAIDDVTVNGTIEF